MSNHDRNDFMYGGQAVIEGVMMRGPKHFSVAVRRANQDIVVATEPISSLLVKLKWLNKPFLRGALALFDALVLGIKALTFSANIAMEDIQIEEAAKKAEASGESPDTSAAPGSPDASAVRGSPDPAPSDEKPGKVNDITVTLTMILGLVLGVGLFIAVPSLLASLAKHVTHNKIWLNIIEGVIRIAIFVGYVAAVSLLKDIRRVFQYHGAEHKIINTYEDHEELTQEKAGERTTVHVRCGSSFILVVLVLSIVVFSFLPWRSGLERVLSRLVLLPVVAGISYEIIRFAGRHRESAFLRGILAPGLWLQKITTRQPSPDQVEVAKVALESVLDVEKRHAAGETIEPAMRTISAAS